MRLDFDAVLQQLEGLQIKRDPEYIPYAWQCVDLRGYRWRGIPQSYVGSRQQTTAYFIERHRDFTERERRLRRDLDSGYTRTTNEMRRIVIMQASHTHTYTQHNDFCTEPEHDMTHPYPRHIDHRIRKLNDVSLVAAVNGVVAESSSVSPLRRLTPHSPTPVPTSIPSPTPTDTPPDARIDSEPESPIPPQSPPPLDLCDFCHKPETDGNDFIIVPFCQHTIHSLSCTITDPLAHVQRGRHSGLACAPRCAKCYYDLDAICNLFSVNFGKEVTLAWDTVGVFNDDYKTGMYIRRAATDMWPWQLLYGVSTCTRPCIFTPILIN